jgi:hypothetical protein
MAVFPTRIAQEVYGLASQNFPGNGNGKGEAE